MKTLENLQPLIVTRLVLAKSIYKSAVELSRTSNDANSLSRSLIALHDALDNFIGAIASNLTVPMKDKSYLMDTIQSIEDYERNSKGESNFSFLHKNEIAHLNTLRGNIKHQGILPNLQQSKGLIGPIATLFREYSKKYFGLDWELISLSDLIKDDAIKKKLKEVEQQIEHQHYKEALNAMAIIKFQVFEEQKAKTRSELGSIIPLPTRKPEEYLLHGRVDIHDRAELLEKGIDRDQMENFERLTAKVRLDKDGDENYLLKHDAHTWGPLNWIRDCALHCFEFLIDIIIKNQGRPLSFSPRKHWTVCTIKSKKEISIYNPHKDAIYTMKENEIRRAFILVRVEKEWELELSDEVLGIAIILIEEKGAEQVDGIIEEKDKNNIEFLITEIYTQDENGNMILISETEGG